jgi:recombinational DNA repair ATPase RecF
MWVEELNLENIKCFEKLTLRCGDKNGAFKWVTLLGENGVGKKHCAPSVRIIACWP